MINTYPLNRSGKLAASALFASLCAIHLGAANAQSAAPVPPSAPKGSPEAAQAKMLQHWLQVDSDKDGQLSKAEVQAAGRGHLAQFFDFIDANKDGKLSESELKAWAAARVAARAQRPPHRAEHGAAHLGNGKAAHHPAHEGGAMGYKTPEQRRADMQERFNKADTNKDGGLSKDELKAAGMNRLLEHFDRIDANKDGRITVEEMQAAWPHRQQ